MIAWECISQTKLFRDKQSSYLQFQKYSQDIRAKIAERLFTDAEKEGLLECHNEVKKCTDDEKENEFKIVKGGLLERNFEEFVLT